MIVLPLVDFQGVRKVCLDILHRFMAMGLKLATALDNSGIPEGAQSIRVVHTKLALTVSSSHRDRHTDRQSDRHTDRHTHRHTHRHVRHAEKRHRQLTHRQTDR